MAPHSDTAPHLDPAAIDFIFRSSAAPWVATPTVVQVAPPAAIRATAACPVSDSLRASK